jgi:cell division protein FtsA
VLPGLAELGLEVTHMPVRIGMPPQLYGVSDNLAAPAYAASVGLLLWVLSHGEGQHIKTDEHQRTFMSDLAHMFSRVK